MKEVFLIRHKHLASPLADEGFRVVEFENHSDALKELKKRNMYLSEMPACVLSDAGEGLKSYQPLLKYSKSLVTKLPVIVLSDSPSAERKMEAFNSGATDYFTYGVDIESLAFRIKSLQVVKTKPASRPISMRASIPTSKRVFDIMVSGSLLLMLSPLFLVIAFLIKLSSKGPVFYSSPRVGTGYKIFPFYKFRSMKVNADHLLKNMKHLNQYAESAAIKEDIDFNPSQGPVLVGDDEILSEDAFQAKVEMENDRAFVKIKNDPRITKIGHFIRNTSIDELPQLFNVLLGHMSIVGNRPLPLYEAEKLTSDDWAMRFMAPAGITGLWQVTERGKSNTTADSRKRLDIEYAKNYSFWMDIKILIKTPLAAFQQENV